jgi:hypothetical protein
MPNTSSSKLINYGMLSAVHPTLLHGFKCDIGNTQRDAMAVPLSVPTMPLDTYIVVEARPEPLLLTPYDT